MTQRRRRRRGRPAAAHSRGAGGRAGRHAVRALSGHAAARAELEPRQHAARSHLDLPAADRRGLRRRGRDPRLRRRDGHPRVRSLLRHERGGDRGDRGEVLARRVDGRRLTRCATRKRFGQHFLEPAWADKVVAAIAAAADGSIRRDRPGPWRADLAARAARRAPDGDRSRSRPRRGPAPRAPRQRRPRGRRRPRRRPARARRRRRSASPATCPTTSRRRSCSG